MKIAIVGYDVEGRVSYDYYAAQGHDLTICDQNPNLVVPDGAASVLGDHYLDDLDRFDLIVRTAGLPPHKIIDKNPSVAEKITTHINEFLRVCPTNNIVGVTGTKGKGTTSTLIARILEKTGATVRLGGNIGLPPLSFLHELDSTSWVVLELSSFQLIDMRTSPKIGVCLMVVPEHLNWHANMAEYIVAKSHLFAAQTAEDTAIYYAHNETSIEIASAGFGQKIPFYAEPGAIVADDTICIDGQAICKVNDLKLIGQHNLQNVCAAVTAVWQISQDVAAIRDVVTHFTGLPHRLEPVRELDGVQYYNDSFAAGLHATIAAVEAISGPKVLVVGGFDRGLDVDHFGDYVAQHADQFRSLVLIGATAGKLADSLQAHGFSNFVQAGHLTTMDEIVHQARELAKPGDAVVLSPGFASFDMFKNFEDRGLKYKAAMNAL